MRVCRCGGWKGSPCIAAGTRWLSVALAILALHSVGHVSPDLCPRGPGVCLTTQQASWLGTQCPGTRQCHIGPISRPTCRVTLSMTVGTAMWSLCCAGQTPVSASGVSLAVCPLGQRPGRRGPGVARADVTGGPRRQDSPVLHAVTAHGPVARARRPPLARGPRWPLLCPGCGRGGGDPRSLQYSSLEAKLCQMESKYLILLQEVKTPVCSEEPGPARGVIAQLLEDALQADGPEQPGQALVKPRLVRWGRQRLWGGSPVLGMDACVCPSAPLPPALSALRAGDLGIVAAAGARWGQAQAPSPEHICVCGSRGLLCGSCPAVQPSPQEWGPRPETQLLPSTAGEPRGPHVGRGLSQPCKVARCPLRVPPQGKPRSSRTCCN